MNGPTLLHRDDGLADTKNPDERLADLELRASTLFMKGPGMLLDVGCGRGRAAIYFATKGYDAIGIDIDRETLMAAKQNALDLGVNCEFLLADARGLCFRSSAFDCVTSFGSSLSEKFRVWLSREDRELIAQEALRVTRGGGIVLFDFVYRYWNAWGFIKFLRNYWVWLGKKLAGARIEFGDYSEKVGSKRIWFHGFTIREVKSLFSSEGVRLRIWKRDRRIFTDWFFVVAEKTPP